MDVQVWRKLYEKIQSPELSNAVVGFNVNLDRIIPVSHELLESSFFQHQDFAVLRNRLLHSMQYCTAEEWFVPDTQPYRRFTSAFSSWGSLVIGGQAGIAALNLARLGVPRVLFAAPSHGPESANMLTKAGVTVLEFAVGSTSATEKIHLVFEYSPGHVSPAA